ncbi:MAG TPA: response regulator transcription factor [Chitinophagaceae bacterium]|nr:response regulator transcription factor [Chitinophagaceae bacterium]
MSIRIGIVDDNQVNRITVKEKLLKYPEVELVLEARNGEDFLEQLKAAEIKPQLILMDLEMPVMDGIQTIAICSPANPDLKFIVLTVFEDNEKIFEAIKAGAHGYLLKDEKAVNIIEAINQVVEYDGMPMSPVIARKAMEMLKRSSGFTAQESAPPADHLLSDREMDILKELATGKSYKAIGEKLFISPFTVRKHVSNIYNKLHVDSRVQVINVAQKNKWV